MGLAPNVQLLQLLFKRLLKGVGVIGSKAELLGNHFVEKRTSQVLLKCEPCVHSHGERLGFRLNFNNHS